MALARDPSTPLLERLRFLCISSNNLDEFFEIRVAGLKQQNAYGSVQWGPDALSARDQLKRISTETHELVAQQYVALNEELLPQLRQQGIRFLAKREWTSTHISWVKRFFTRETIAGIKPVRPGPGTSLSPDPKQESQLSCRSGR